MSDADILSGLPGEALIRTGLADLQSGRRSIAAFLVEIARTRLSQAGLTAPSLVPVASEAEPELELYRTLRTDEGDAYARYNALMRELASFEAALDHRLRKAIDAPVTGRAQG